MRSSPAVRRAPVHRFADGVSARAPKRSVEQAVQHEVPIPAHTGIVDPNDLPPSDASVPIGNGDVSWTITQQAQPSAIALGIGVSDEDIDRLWDWCREDAEGVKAFLGIEPKTSRDLFRGIERIQYLQMANPPTSIIRTITRGTSLIGFVIISPIQRPQGQPPVGTVHLYLAMPERGHLSEIISGLLAAFDGEYEPMTLSVIANRDWTPVLEPLGFVSQTVLTRPALKPDGSTWV